MSSPTRPAGHEATFGAVTIFYNYLFEVADGLPVDDAAKRLLSSGIAETAAWPVDRELALSPRYTRLAKTRGRALSMISIEDFYSGILKFRQLTPQARWMLIKIQIGAVIRVAKRGLASDSPDSDDGSIRAKMEEVVAEIDGAMDELRFDPLLQCAIDRDLYRPGYLESAPYVRLKLRSFQVVPGPSADWRVNESDGNVWVRVSVILHRSGVAILSFEASIEAGADAKELIPLAVGNRTDILGSTVSDPVFQACAKWRSTRPSNVGGALLAQELEGVKWRSLGKGGEVHFLTEVFHIYRDAVSQVLNRAKKPGITLIYPTVFVESLECCGNREAWLASHGLELTGIASASIAYERFTDKASERMLGDDQAHSLGVRSG